MMLKIRLRRRRKGSNKHTYTHKRFIAISTRLSESVVIAGNVFVAAADPAGQIMSAAQFAHARQQPWRMDIWRGWTLPVQVRRTLNLHAQSSSTKHRNSSRVQRDSDGCIWLLGCFNSAPEKTTIIDKINTSTHSREPRQAFTHVAYRAQTSPPVRCQCGTKSPIEWHPRRQTKQHLDMITENVTHWIFRSTFFDIYFIHKYAQMRLRWRIHWISCEIVCLQTKHSALSTD